jgi:hypothetical protein
MTFLEFVAIHDKPGAVVLLEGKREVPAEDQDRLRALGRMVAGGTKHITFRSGNAEGSDHFFSEGVAGVDPKRLQVITPYSGHRSISNLAHETVALDQINLLAEQEVVYQSKSNKKTEKLIDRFVAGDHDRFTIKAAYILRDTVKAIGTKDVKPATFGIFYDDLANPRSGGTGHTMQVCEANGIPLIDQRVWMGWLTKNIT